MKIFDVSPVERFSCLGKAVLQSGRMLLIGGVLSTAWGIVDGADVRIEKISMKVSTGGSIVFKNDLSVGTEAVVRNEGVVYLTNEKENTISLNTILGGSGIYYINGNAACTIEGDGAAVSSLDIESGNTVSVANDFSVSGVLTLGSGIVKVEEGASLKIQDASAESIVFNDSYGNSSFVDGDLERNTSAGTEYIFPVGTARKGYHPFKADRISSSGYIGVKYREDYVDTWNSGNHNGITLEDAGAWEVSTGSEGITFRSYLSLYCTDGLLDGNYNLFYTSDAEDASPNFALDYNSVDAGDGIYLTSGTAYKSGLFGVSRIKTTVDEESGEQIPEMVNYLAQNGTGRTRFEIPGIENYQKITLTVFDRFGNKVYESSKYANDFNARDYRPGTYYYELTLEDKEGKRILSRNIIEIMRYD